MTEAEAMQSMLSTPEQLHEQRLLMEVGLDADAAESLVIHHGIEVCRLVRAEAKLTSGRAFRESCKTSDQWWLFLRGIALGIQLAGRRAHEREFADPSDRFESMLDDLAPDAIEECDELGCFLGSPRKAIALLHQFGGKAVKQARQWAMSYPISIDDRSAFVMGAAAAISIRAAMDETDRQAAAIPAEVIERDLAEMRAAEEATRRSGGGSTD